MISCLCVTHERPEFMPWVEHQFEKQTENQEAELIIVDSSQVPWVSESSAVFHVKESGISEKRTIALSLASGDAITWFDDDDWQHPEKLGQGAALSWRTRFEAIGARHAYMYSCATGRAALYESTYEPIIFNSAVYRKSSVPKSFDPNKITGEDTDWHERWLRTRPSYVTLGQPMHAWLCHTRNITNKSSSRFFELGSPIPFDAWELDFIADMKRRNF